MTAKEAIKIIDDECEHIKSHLTFKGKAEEYYKELGDMCIAFYMGINALEAIENIKSENDKFKQKAGVVISQLRADRDRLENKLAELEQEPKTEKVIKMREATPEEIESVDKYVKSISKPTGVNFEALEQEPTPNEILDKIRAEIDAHRKILKDMADTDDWYAGKLNGYDCAIEIIDKYKAESEE